MASIWRTVVIPTPAESGVHYSNTAWDTSDNLTSMMIGRTTSYNPSGFNTSTIKGLGIDQFGFTVGTTDIALQGSQAGTGRFNIIQPTRSEATAFYVDQVPFTNTYNLNRDIMSIANDGTITHHYSTLLTIPTASDNLYTSYRNSGAGAGGYSAAWDTGSGQSKTANILLFNSADVITTFNGQPVTKPIVDDGTPAYQFRSGLAAYVYVNEQVVSDVNSPNFNDHFIHIEGMNPDGSLNTNFVPFNVSSKSIDITDLKFSQFSTGLSQYMVAYNEKNVSSSDAQPVNNVVVKFLTPGGSPGTVTRTFETSKGAASQLRSADQKVRITIDNALGIAVVAFGDAFGTHLKEFNAAGTLLDSIDLPGVPFQLNDEGRGTGLGSMDDGRFLVVSQVDQNTVTTAETLTYVDFRTAALNINNAGATSAFHFEYAGTNFASGDVVIGSNANRDLFMGMGGNDTFNGGGNTDTAIFQGARSQYTVTSKYISGVLTTTVAHTGGSQADGTDTLTNTELLRFADVTTPSVQRKADFNGDGRSDVLFSQDGAVFSSNYEWQINDRSIASQGAIDLYDKSFTTQIVGDYNGDGKSDIIFQNPNTGGVWQWQLNGTSILSQGAVDVADPSFHLLGAGDFNGDGRSDLIFRNDAGFIYMWKMDGRVNTPVPVSALDPSWHLQGTGDFNGDGKADLLLRNISSSPSENGAFFLWLMDGNNILGQGGVERPPTTWKTLGIGDFDGDGKSDFAVRNVNDGAVWVYLMNGTTIKGQGAAGIADAAQFPVQLIGDLNGDGKDDVLFRNSAGFFYSWDMNGTSIASEGGFGAQAGNWAPPELKVVTDHWDLV